MAMIVLIVFILIAVRRCRYQLATAKLFIVTVMLMITVKAYRDKTDADFAC